MTPAERRAVEADVERLIKLYVNRNDAQDWEAVAALYTEDARFARPSKPGEFVEGRAAILAGFRARPPRAQRHVIANVVVDVESASAARAFSVIGTARQTSAQMTAGPAAAAKNRRGATPALSMAWPSSGPDIAPIRATSTPTPIAVDSRRGGNR